MEVGRRSDIRSTASTMMSIGGMVQLDIDVRCVWMDERMAVVLIGAVAASVTGLARMLHQYLL